MEFIIKDTLISVYILGILSGDKNKQLCAWKLLFFFLLGQNKNSYAKNGGNAQMAAVRKTYKLQALQEVAKS